MRRRPWALLLALGVVGVCGVVVVAGSDQRSMAFTTNVRAVAPAAVAEPGQRACQVGLYAGASFDAVELLLGTKGAPGPPLHVTVRERGSGRVLAVGRLPADARDNQGAVVRLGSGVPKGAPMDVCVRNDGAGDIVFYGGPSAESPGHSFVEGRPGAGDMRLVFLRSEPRSALSLVPDMFEHAARFRPGFVGAWTYWGLLALLAGGVPLLLARALRAAVHHDGGDEVAA